VWLEKSAFATFACALFAFVGCERDPVRIDTEGYVGSAECTRCHESHARSFEATFHRSMTREATPENARALFDDQTLTYGGITARMTTSGSGARPFVVTLTRDGVLLDRVVVDRFVGSGRHQQLLAREDDRWVRLPVAWNVEEQRWFHMNEAFLTADPEGLESAHVSTADFARHVTSWNDNCVFCHNVRPAPHQDATGHFETEVAELGVACEACHGPGAAHVRANENPLRRYALHHGGIGEHAADESIINPARLSPDRSAEVCGRCHGQRITTRIERFMHEGDSYMPGDDLSAFSTPITRDTPLHGDTQAFASRFWPSGTPRLTAYEYQGLLQSPCEGLTCTSCHGMHEGAPRNQLRPSVADDVMCTQCHEDIRGEARAEHIGISEADHSNVQCIDCHMPRIVFGLRSVHISHRIEVPTAQNEGQPSACNLCHVNDTESLFAGDPIERAVMANALGLPERRSAHEPRALLLETMRDDPYPAVRAIAWTSLRALEPSLALSRFQSTLPAAERRRLVDVIATELDVEVAPPSEHAEARAQASAHAIEIGE
jgi:predicted CXXCH cytochrome family protein